MLYAVASSYAARGSKPRAKTILFALTRCAPLRLSEKRVKSARPHRRIDVIHSPANRHPRFPEDLPNAALPDREWNNSGAWFYARRRGAGHPASHCRFPRSAIIGNCKNRPRNPVVVSTSPSTAPHRLMAQSKLDQSRFPPSSTPLVQAPFRHYRRRKKTSFPFSEC